LLVRAGAGGPAGEGLARQRPQAEDVGALVHQLAPGLLRRHVAERPHHRTGLRLLGRTPGVSGLVLPLSRLVLPLTSQLTLAVRQDFRQSPVGDLDLAEGAHHDIARLDVAVHHAARVRVGKRLAHLQEGAQEARQVSRGSLSEQLGQGAALDQLHAEEGPAVGQPADGVDRRDAGVLELPGEARLVHEAAFQLWHFRQSASDTSTEAGGKHFHHRRPGPSGVLAATPDALADSRALAAFFLAFCLRLRALLVGCDFRFRFRPPSAPR
jgi:hypothetical protein